MPAYNESATIAAAVKRVLEVNYPCEVELVIVDDASTDRTAEALSGMGGDFTLVRHEINRGKSAAVRTGAAAAKGDFLLVCDADLEYDPNDIPQLLEPVLAGKTTVVYGSRQFGSHNSYSYVYVLGNRLVVLAMNCLFNVYLSDVETCFKLMPLELFRDLDVKSSGFGMEAEVTAKLLRRGIRPYEVPIAYQARSREAGKKLHWTDGVQALIISVGVRLTGEPPRFTLSW
jgi:dolichol-phosphate hexosyltransferase